MLSADLWRQNQDLALACLEHPFVQGIASGALPRSSFSVYVAQDAFFLEAFARAYALALAKSPDRTGLYAFHELLKGVFDELNLHQGYARSWGIDLTPEPLAATSAYTSFLLSVAALEPIGHIAAAMTPCMRLYAYLGQSLAGGLNAASPYKGWVDTYSADELEALACKLEALLDQSTGDALRIERHYRTAMRLELEFFESAWRAVES